MVKASARYSFLEVLAFIASHMLTFTSVCVGPLDFQSSCVRRPKFIVCTGGNPSGYIPTHTSQNSTTR